MTLETEITYKRIATYERVSSDDQKLRETIKNQTENIARSLQLTPGCDLSVDILMTGFQELFRLVNDPVVENFLRTRHEACLMKSGFGKLIALGEMMSTR